jgi:hypothetical protein
MIDLNESQDAIYINDNEDYAEHTDDDDRLLAKAQRKVQQQHDVAKFEIFESSSDDELSQGAFESAAQSYIKR